ncbi:MAG: DUF4160 domain-containing protein [Verrucomicrobia bacterium]|nr:DUF4160 domain-containing protein [Verrucomicrobiota bacterium]
MPTVLMINGWRFHFYANEGNEPMHIHAVKAEKECKYWIDADGFKIREAFGYNMSPRDTREVRQLIFEHFDHIVAEWRRVQGN